VTGFVLLGLAAIASLTAITCTALVMQAKERMHTRSQDDYAALTREQMALARSANRDIARSLGQRTDGDQ
jgi:hypothetical protein